MKIDNMVIIRVMTQSIVIDLRNACPALKDESGRDKWKISLVPSRESLKHYTCDLGGESVALEIIGDRMVQKIGDVEVKCRGCEHNNCQPVSYTERKRIS
jgi:hypothetical protein